MSAALKLSTEKVQILDGVSQGYHVQSKVRRKTQLHESSIDLDFLVKIMIIFDIAHFSEN